MRNKSWTSLRGSIENALNHCKTYVDRRYQEDGEPDGAMFIRSWVIPPLERALKKATKKAVGEADNQAGS